MGRDNAIKLSLDKNSYAKFSRQLEKLEKAARKEIVDRALLAGGQVIKDAADSRAPSSQTVVLETLTGRTLKKKRKTLNAKSSARFAAVGVRNKRWFDRFFEFGASKHDISVSKPGSVAFEGNAGLVVVPFAKNTGGVPMRPFLRPAVDEKGAAAITAMGEVLKREIEAAVRG